MALKDRLATCTNCGFDIRLSQAIQGPSESFYESLLNTNSYPRSSQELASVKVQLKEAGTQRALLESKIALLKEAVASMEEEEVRLSEVIQRCRAILRPIHMLPPEILGKVFALSVERPRLDCWAVSGSLDTWTDCLGPPSRMPWTLAQVCQPWRSLALTTPTLWSNFTLSLRGMDVPTFSTYHLSLQIQRSGDQPLNIITANLNPGDNFTKDTSLMLLSSLTSPRWKHLEIQYHRTMEQPLSFVRGRLDTLQSLNLHFVTSLESSLESFEFAPQLQRVVISGTLNTRIAMNLKLPWDQITEYIWRDIPWPSFVSWSAQHTILNRLTNLKSCRLHCHPNTVTSFDPAEDVDLELTFPELEELELHSADESRGVQHVLGWITAPSLTKFTLNSMTGKNRTHFSDFFAHPSVLTSLTMTQINMPHQELASLLARLPSLISLALGVADPEGITDKYVTIFISTGLVPNLRRLSLLPNDLAKSTYSEETVLTMLEVRCKPSFRGPDPSFQNRLLFVQLDRKIEGSVGRGRLQQLRMSGVDVQENKMDNFM